MFSKSYGEHWKSIMADYILAGASSIESIPDLMETAWRANASVRLIENDAMFHKIPSELQSVVARSEKLPDGCASVIPLNEYWVSQVIKSRTANISSAALRASRSKHYLSERLSQCGLDFVPRRYLDAVTSPFPQKYVARLDAAYSGYGIARHIEAGPFDPTTISKTVLGDVSDSLRHVLGDAESRVVVEAYLEGDEHSVDVFVHQGQVKLLRLFYKTVIWVRGKPVCDSYIALPISPAVSEAVHAWCKALFSPQCTSFGQFDFIVVKDKILPIDFSCRIGGGLTAIKRFSNISCYTASSLFEEVPSFRPFTVQKNIVCAKAGLIVGMRWELPEGYQKTLHKRCGDQVPENISSANARIAEVCFSAQSLQEAVQLSRQMDDMVVIDVQR
jgi:hypothetical protein